LGSSDLVRCFALGAVPIRGKAIPVEMYAVVTDVGR
jgi:hypothetical protein